MFCEDFRSGYLYFMDAESKINQLVDLMADLIPNVDKLMRMQEKTNIEMSEMRTSNMRLAEIIEKLSTNQETTNHEMIEMRSANNKLTEAIEHLIVKLDHIHEFETRLARLEKTVFK